MYVLRSSQLPRISLVILISLLSLTAIPSTGYSDDWVYAGRTGLFTLYYNASSVKIDKQSKIIEVWTKRVFTDKGKIDILKNFEKIKDYNDISYEYDLYLLNYKELKMNIKHITRYSQSDNILLDGDPTPIWRDIIPGSILEGLVNILLMKDDK
jgi:hypothetical protein